MGRRCYEEKWTVEHPTLGRLTLQKARAVLPFGTWQSDLQVSRWQDRMVAVQDARHLPMRALRIYLEMPDETIATVLVTDLPWDRSILPGGLARKAFDVVTSVRARLALRQEYEERERARWTSPFAPSPGMH